VPLAYFLFIYLLYIYGRYMEAFDVQSNNKNRITQNVELYFIVRVKKERPRTLYCTAWNNILNIT
jgi:hypothetical protein